MAFVTKHVDKVLVCQLYQYQTMHYTDLN